MKILKVLLALLLTIIIHFVVTSISLDNENSTIEWLLSLIAAILLTSLLTDTKDT
ncbi:hypothetical protein [uncultured Brevibacillus sp.]|uniref:hypothetical protein n=1 Tax=uncultured Brevibacillus sp. TaxID=169970 RepID=UPI00259658CB|nr:hypothetical protein [uncultured Brevibacillus sp.]